MAISEILLNLVFYAVALAALGGGLAVALSKNIVRSAFALLTVLFAVAAVYALVRADFIVAAQILIYVGGILVLIIFAIMLTHKITDVKLSNESAPGPVSVTACACVFVLLVAAFVVGGAWERSPKEVPQVVFSAAGRPEIPAHLTMWQGDGGTGVNTGHAVLDGFVRLRVKTWAPLKDKARATFQVTKIEPPGKEPPKGAKVKPETRVARFEREADGSGVATAEFDRLAEGKYQWKVRLEDVDGETAWVDFPGVSGVAFGSEKGLTRAIGRAFMGPYLLAFEVVSVLLLAALVGAAFLARKEVRE